MTSDAACHTDRGAQDAYASYTNWTYFMASDSFLFFFSPSLKSRSILFMKWKWNNNSKFYINDSMLT